MVVGSFRNFFGSLGGAVGSGRESRPDDVAQVQDAMRDLGRYPTGRVSAEAGILDDGLDRAIRGYQADRGLKRDGWLAPRGETAGEIGTDLGLLHLARASGNRLGLTPDRAEDIMRSRASTFDNLGWLGNKLGLGDGGFGRAKDYLNHYLGATGTQRMLTSKEVEAEPVLRNAERANLRNFEAQTFTARTGNENLNKALRDLQDGQRSIGITDNFETSLSFLDHLHRPGTYFTLGRGAVRSDLNFDAKRVGDQIGIQGWVTHRLDNRGKEDNDRNIFGDRYNFEQPQPGSAEARVLERSGRAQPFDVNYARKQSFNAILRRSRDGELTLERSIWGDSE